MTISDGSADDIEIFFSSVHQTIGMKATSRYESFKRETIALYAACFKCSFAIVVAYSLFSVEF